jgi:hypothetical protein
MSTVPRSLAVAAAAGTFCIGLVVGALFQTPAAIDGDSSNPFLSQTRWMPCFDSLSSAGIVQGHKDWAEMMESQGLNATVGGGFQVVPRGPNAGEWIMPGCTAFETITGHVSYWKDRSGATPAWVPYAGVGAKDGERG